VDNSYYTVPDKCGTPRSGTVDKLLYLLSENQPIASIPERSEEDKSIEKVNLPK